MSIRISYADDRSYRASFCGLLSRYGDLIRELTEAAPAFYETVRDTAVFPQA